MSAHHQDIEALTNGGCTFDGSLAVTLPPPAEAPMSAARASRTLASPSVASVASRTPAATATVADDRRPSPRTRQSVPNLQEHLDRLAEPTLWEDCGSDKTSYRLLKFDANQYLAAVRITHDANAGAFRSVTSESPDSSIGLDGYVDDRMWTLVETRMESSGFWSLQTDPNADNADSIRIYLEACRNGAYHALQSGPRDSRLAQVAQIFARVGKLDWLEN